MSSADNTEHLGPVGHSIMSLKHLSPLEIEVYNVGKFGLSPVPPSKVVMMKCVLDTLNDRYSSIYRYIVLIMLIIHRQIISYAFKES